MQVLSRLFRGSSCSLQDAFDAGKLRFFGNLAVWPSPRPSPPGSTNSGAAMGRLRQAPFGGPEQVLDYLGRYTHRVAITNSRLVSLSDGKVRFTWKDYRQTARPS